MPKSNKTLINLVYQFAAWFKPRRVALGTCAVLFFAVAANLYILAPEVIINPRPLNDNLFHLINLSCTVRALSEGRDPTDFWLAPVGLGYPLFHHYQHLGYLPLAWLQHLLGGKFSLISLMNWTNYLLLSLFPLSIYYAMRQFRFGRSQSAIAGLLSSLLSTPSLFGVDFASYIWRGSGLYTQLWAMVLLPLALARGYITLRTGRGYFWAILTLTGTLLSHLVAGYIAGFSLVVVAIFAGPKPQSLARRISRLMLIAALSALAASYFLLPFWADRAFMNRSIWEGAEKYGSYGYDWVLHALFRGDLLDFGRFPSLSLLSGLGLVVCLKKWRQPRYRVPVLLAVVWLVLFFGRPTWGVLLNLLPLSKEMHFHRLILGVHIGAIFLMGIGLATLVKWSFSRSSILPKVGVVVLTGALLYPVYKERLEYLDQNKTWILENEAAIAAETPDLDRLIAFLVALPPGRVYAGQGNNWGEQYRVGSVPMYAYLSLTNLDMLGFNYHALSLNTDITVLFDDTQFQQYNLFNVRYLVSPVDHPAPSFANPLGTFGRHALYEVKTSGYFDLVDSTLEFSGSKSDFYPVASTWLSSSLPALKQYPVLNIESTNRHNESAPLPVSQLNQAIADLEAASTPSQDRGKIRSEYSSEGLYRAEVTVFQESTLLLKATYHPGWRVTLNGLPIQPVMVMPSYIGTNVSPGVYQVKAEYQSTPNRRSLQILGLATLVFVGILEWRGFRFKRFSRADIIERLFTLGKTDFHRIAKKKTLKWYPQKLEAHMPNLLVVLVLVILVGLPLFQFDLLSGHDTGEYIPRSVEFLQGLKGGQLFPRWAPDLSAGYGQPFFNFNPPMFYYLTAIIQLVGFNHVASQDMAILVVLFLAAIGMYLLGADIFGPRAGLVISTAYLFSPYFLTSLYVRHALADFIAFAFIPFATWGLYRFIRDGTVVFLLVGSTSLAFLTLSANPISLITLPVLMFLIFWLSYRMRSRSAMLRGFWCLGLGVGLAAFFWLPALAEMKYTQLFRLKEGYLNFKNHFVYPGQLLYSPWGFGLSNEGPQDGMSFSVGLIYLLMALTALFLIDRIAKHSQDGFSIIVFSLFVFTLAAFFASNLSEFLWLRVPLLQNLEFPWRFLSLVSVSTALLFGFPFLLINPQAEQQSSWLARILIAILFLSGFPKAHPMDHLNVNERDYSPQAISEENMAVTTAREYQPIWVELPSSDPPIQDITLLEGEAHIFTNRVSPTLLIAQINVLLSARLRANVNYFPGWTLKVDQIQRSVDISYPQGVMEFDLEPGDHVIELRFEATPIRAVGRILSMLAIFCLIGSAWKIKSPWNRGDRTKI